MTTTEYRCAQRSGLNGESGARPVGRSAGLSPDALVCFQWKQYMVSTENALSWADAPKRRLKADGTVDPATTAIALRAVLRRATALTERERAILEEWLDRIAGQRRACEL